MTSLVHELTSTKILSATIPYTIMLISTELLHCGSRCSYIFMAITVHWLDTKNVHFKGCICLRFQVKGVVT